MEGAEIQAKETSEAHEVIFAETSVWHLMKDDLARLRMIAIFSKT